MEKNGISDAHKSISHKSFISLDFVPLLLSFAEISAAAADSSERSSRAAAISASDRHREATEDQVFEEEEEGGDVARRGADEAAARALESRILQGGRDGRLGSRVNRSQLQKSNTKFTI